ncbi:hypothetical protein C5167_045466 [Papaver somniferum]|uniref:Uncharacterized protein n=1 Tax=Papaver somniferum TaxID=3469 RepID=A0A4Y7LDI0_PAPSO|nr:hypothetical protein C5167_045466 [Papaver somniferum]
MALKLSFIWLIMVIMKRRKKKNQVCLLRQSNKFEYVIPHLVIPCAPNSIDRLSPHNKLRNNFCMKLRKGNRETPTKLLKRQEAAAKRVRAIT